MFGYIKPYKPELRFREFEEYRAVYCGLCHQLGKNGGILWRFTLSYDFAFLAMLLSSLDEEACPSFEKCRCAAHPFKKQTCCQKNTSIEFAADAAAILTYYKLKDDLADRGFFKKIKAALFMPFAKKARNAALKKGGKTALLDSAAAEMTAKQAALEAEKCPLSDKAAEPTAEMLGEMLALCAKGERQEKILRRFGYLVGRYVYLCDALDDLEDDRKKGNYNPFICGNGDTSAAKGALFLTTAELGDDLALLELNSYKGAIENIVNLGLRAEVERIINAKGGKTA